MMHIDYEMRISWRLRRPINRPLRRIGVVLLISINRGSGSFC